MDGFFLINKEQGWTSFDCCAKIRKLMDTKHVGHSGTLDPFAEGVLIVAINKATKTLAFMDDEKKEYTATIKLGTLTDTMDDTGKVIEEKEVPLLEEQQIQEVLLSFLGEQEQLPPMYSALKYQGLPLYTYAREGIEIERKKRKIHIDAIRLLSYTNNQITFSCRVSKGTYVRVLGVDIANKLGTTGHLVSLTRTSIGSIKLSECKKINQITKTDLLPIEKILVNMKQIIIEDHLIQKVKNGNPLSIEEEGTVLLISKEKQPLAIYEKRSDGLFYCKRGLMG